MSWGSIYFGAYLENDVTDPIICLELSISFPLHFNKMKTPCCGSQSLHNAANAPSPTSSLF